MKTTTLKKAMQVILFCALILATAIITKHTIKNIKQLYCSERGSGNIITCFSDMIY